jgi:hypothetical protein
MHRWEGRSVCVCFPQIGILHINVLNIHKKKNCESGEILQELVVFIFLLQPQKPKFITKKKIEGRKAFSQKKLASNLNSTHLSAQSKPVHSLISLDCNHQ